MGSAASTAYTLGQEGAGSTSVGAGLGGVARAAGNAAGSSMSSSLGFGEAREAGRSGAWNAINGKSSGGAGQTQDDARSVPGWARAMKAQSAARQHQQTALHTIQQGDRGGHGAAPDIKERED
jgi:type IV secretion system protein TrbL